MHRTHCPVLPSFIARVVARKLFLSMARRNFDLYVRSARLAAGLSQRELGDLLGFGEDFVRKCELGQRAPTIRFVLGCEIIFGRRPVELFPKLVQTLQEEIGTQAAKLDAQLRDRSDAASLKKNELLISMVRRLTARRSL
jgi:transcriptional regulator with XRE-family HTH domain